MRNPFFASFVLLIACTMSSAFGQSTKFAVTNGWEIYHYASSNKCEAYSAGKDEYMVFAIYPDKNLSFYFSSKKLSWLEKEEKYDVKVVTERYDWNGSMIAYRPSVDDGYLGLSDANLEFFSDLKRSNRLEIVVDNVTYGPLSLKGSSKAIDKLFECGEAARSGAFKPPAPTELTHANLHTWGEDELGKPHTIYKWQFRVERQENLDGSADVYLVAAYDGGPERTLKVEDSSFPSGSWGVFPFEYRKDALYFTSYTGGAHCCTKSILLTLDGDRIDVGIFDGEGPQIRDLDYDGTYEVLTYDQRFLYAFASYVESFGPDEILQLRGKKFTDVSTSPRFTDFMLREFVDDYSRIVNDQDARKSQGQVAGILAAAAKMGMYTVIKEDFSEMLNKMSPDWDLSCSSEVCGQQKDFSTFGGALEFWLNRWGYQTDDGLSDDALDYFEKLAALGPEKSDDSELTCSDSKFEITFDREKRTAGTSGWEHSCSFTKATILGDSALAHALCWGEGMVWSQYYQLEHDGVDLYMQTWDESPISVLSNSTKTKPRKICR